MQCPGQDNRYWDGEAVFEAPCPHCGNVLEFFKDDSQRSCRQCGNKVLNPKMDFGCATYCPYADQCLGDMPPEVLEGRGDLFRDRLALSVRKRLHTTPEQYKLAEKRSEYGEQICKEEQGNMPVAVASALLKDLPDWKEVLVELKGEESLIQSVESLLTGAAAESSAAAKNGDIFFDCCLLGDTFISKQIDEEQNCRTNAGRKLLDELIKTLKK
ncbi:MAG: phosphohydrolase [Thermodesulfobacteriota bacterium]